MIATFVNTFLNNYTKKCNDALQAAGGKKGASSEQKGQKRRKLDTLK